MGRSELEANLNRLCQNLEDYAGKNGIAVPNPPSNAAGSLSACLFLAHSTSVEKFSAICASGRLSSAARLAAERGETLDPKKTEVVLGTAGSVFLYLAPFRYPHTGCGLLFAVTLESEHQHDGSAAPFDTGWLLRVPTRPDPSGPPRDFLARHEMPVPDHRRYLCLSMDVLFHRPGDYVEGVDPARAGPIGLTEGDPRRWTHEVRIPDHVWIRGGHLQAVFAPKSQVAADPDIEDLFTWCVREGVDRIQFDAPRASDFEALRRECLAYIRRTLQ
jgi:hypothetical protein